jgi:hypothetical protein
VQIVASGTVTVDGVITMNGLDGAWDSGGGSGGGVYIQCGRLSGSGAIRANGGSGAGQGGGGGGGRIAVYAATPGSFGGEFSAKNGSGIFTFPDADRKSALPGTVYLYDWGILPGFLTNGAARWTAGTGTAGNVTISNYSMFLEWGWETNRLKAGTVTVQNTGKIRHAWNTDTAAPWVPNAGIFIECSNLTVQAGGEINGNGLGYGTAPATYSNGYGPGRGSSASGYGGGAGYGGVGGPGWGGGGGATYGTSNNPASPGSGSGGGFNVGTSGGGYVQIVASGTVAVEATGTITMNGLDGAWDSGGGSGGGVYIQCGRLSGSGTIRANGGNGGGHGGGGGGGRIALFVRNAPFYTSGNILCTPSVTGGAKGSAVDGTQQPGGTGTIYRDLGKSCGTVLTTW